MSIPESERRAVQQHDEQILQDRADLQREAVTRSALHRERAEEWWKRVHPASLIKPNQNPDTAADLIAADDLEIQRIIQEVQSTKDAYVRANPQPAGPDDTLSEIIEDIDTALWALGQNKTDSKHWETYCRFHARLGAFAGLAPSLVNLPEARDPIIGLHDLRRWSLAASRRIDVHVESVSIATIKEWTRLSANTLSRYAKSAGVQTPRRGQRNFKYPVEDARKVLKFIVDHCTDRHVLERTRVAMRDHF